MALPKFITALKALSDDERKKFEKYVSHFHQTKTETFEILSYVTKRAGDIESEATMSDIKGKKFKNHSNKAFANYLSVLYTLLEEWLIKITLDSDPQLKDVLLVKAFQNYGLYQVADKYYSKIASGENEYYYTQLYKWLAHFEIYFSHNPHKYAIGAGAASDLCNSFQLYTEYAADIIKAELINWNLLYQFDPVKEIQFLEKISTGNHGENKHKYLKTISGLLTSFDLQKYLNLVYNFVQNPPDKGSFEEVLLTFYLIRLNNIGQKRAQGLTYENTSKVLYDFAFSRGILNQRGSLLPHVFRNFVNNLAEVNSLQFSLDFVESYAQYMHSSFPEESKTLIIALVYLKHGDYDAVIHHTRHKNFHDVAEKKLCFSMNLAAWFTKRNTEPEVYLNTKNSFKGYFKRNPDKQSQEVVNSHLAFVSVLEEIEKGKAEINLSKYTNLMNRRWVTNYMRSNNIPFT